jgi:hypothetical protein
MLFVIGVVRGSNRVTGGTVRGRTEPTLFVDGVTMGSSWVTGRVIRAVVAAVLFERE